jgi:hypothetical protein
MIGGFILMAAISSCSAESRYKRLVKKHPELVKTDTVIVKDTIIREIKVPVPEYRDSFIIKHDTLIETEKLIIYRKGDLLDITVKPDTVTFRDTIPFEVKVPGKVVEITKPLNYNIVWILLVIGFLVGVIVNKR